MMTIDTATLTDLNNVDRLNAIVDHLKSIPLSQRAGVIEAFQRGLKKREKAKLKYAWPLYAPRIPAPARRRLGHLAHPRWTRLRQNSRRRRMGPRSGRGRQRTPHSPSRAHHTRSPVHHDRGRVRHHQRLATMEQAHIRTIQAKAHMAHRSARTRLLKPRARPAQRPTIRRRMVRRARLMGIPGTDLGQPLLRTQARTTATLSRHHHPQAHRACAHPDRQPRHFHHTRLHLR